MKKFQHLYGGKKNEKVLFYEVQIKIDIFQFLRKIEQDADNMNSSFIK